MNSERLAQVRGMLRLELRKNLLSTRALPMYLLAALPVAVVAIIILVSVVVGRHEQVDQPPAAVFFAYLYQLLILRGIIYFGCVWLFMNLFRGEVLDRSLHYYFLSPLRREVLVVGKYLSAWTTTTVLFASSTAVSYVALYGYLSAAGVSGALRGTSLSHLLAYIGVTALGCLGYGAVFLLVGLFIRNPIIPALVILFWEWINGFLPVLLKKFSVVHYLHSLMPVPADQGPLAIVAEPVSAWLAVPGLVLFTALTMFVASLRIRRMEISYASD
jgi:ABC-type transport system involved in multi-copper enzyme maturation permease subunit